MSKIGREKVINFSDEGCYLFMSNFFFAIVRFLFKSRKEMLRSLKIKHIVEEKVCFDRFLLVFTRPFQYNEDVWFI